MSDPRIWGSDLWKTLHRLSLAYPIEPTTADREAAYELLHALTRLLPCPACRTHYTRHFEKTFDKQTTTASRDALVRWIYELHASVNERLHKTNDKNAPVTLDDLPRLYNAFPMRYVDTKTGALLASPRYSTTGSVVCSSDAKARRALGRRIDKLNRAHTRMLADTKSNEDGKMNERSALSSATPSTSAAPTNDSWWIIAIVAAIVLVVLVAVVAALLAVQAQRRRARTRIDAQKLRPA